MTETWNVWDDRLEDGRLLASIVSGKIPTPEQRLRQFAGQLSWLPGERGETVLDVGCGNGNCHRPLTELFGLFYSGCDISENMLRIAREENPECDFQLARAEKLPYADNSFDLTLCLAVLLHLPREYEEPIITELRRVSRRYAVVGQRCALNSAGHCVAGKYDMLSRVDPLEDVVRRAQAIDPAVEMHIGTLTGPHPTHNAYAGAQRYNIGVYLTFRKESEAE